MGSMTGIELATNLDLPLEKAIGYHLQGNHYPPVPLSMVQPCIEAIDAYYDEDYERFIAMPEGVFYKGMSHAPARAIVDQHQNVCYNKKHGTKVCRFTYTRSIND